jgi:hypothetical protein
VHGPLTCVIFVVNEIERKGRFAAVVRHDSIEGLQKASRQAQRQTAEVGRDVDTLTAMCLYAGHSQYTYGITPIISTRN